MDTLVGRDFVCWKRLPHPQASAEDTGQRSHVLLSAEGYITCCCCRTGTVYNTLGYDSFSLGEATAGDVMQQAGYTTSHFGKW